MPDAQRVIIETRNLYFERHFSHPLLIFFYIFAIFFPANYVHRLVKKKAFCTDINAYFPLKLRPHILHFVPLKMIFLKNFGSFVWEQFSDLLKLSIFFQTP